MESVANNICNESFRAAIQKRYDGLDDTQDDGLSDQETQMFEPSLQENPELEKCGKPGEESQVI